jgi:hypothetical protein
MNEDTLVAVCCYAGDRQQVLNAMPLYMHHDTPVVVFSPEDSGVLIPGFKVYNEFVGKACYIGPESWTRQKLHFEALLRHPQNYFLLHDSDSFCLSAKIPRELYRVSKNTLWSNEVTEPRPHASKYPKLAFQPPYFFSREVAERMVLNWDKVGYEIQTPYIDFIMNAVSAEAGVHHRPFTALEHTPLTEEPCTTKDPWEVLEYRIKFMGSTMMHPIKTMDQIRRCINAREFYFHESAR